MSDEKAASAAVKAALVKTADAIAENGIWGNEELRVLAEAVSRLTTSYIQLIASGE